MFYLRLTALTLVTVIFLGCTTKNQVDPYKELEENLTKAKEEIQKECAQWFPDDITSQLECIRQKFELEESIARYKLLQIKVKMMENELEQQNRGSLYIRIGGNPDPNANTHIDGQTVYDPNECVGPIINGECHGTIVPTKAYHKKCYGEMINGICTGPMF